MITRDFGHPRACRCADCTKFDRYFDELRAVTADPPTKPVVIAEEKPWRPSDRSAS